MVKASMLWIRKLLYIARGELLYQTDEDARWKFDNHPQLETKPGVVRAVFEYIN